MKRKKLGLVTLHGMGNPEETYFVGLRDALLERLGPHLWDEIAFEPIYFSRHMQDSEEAVWTRMLEHKLHYASVRQWLLYGFSDATSLEYSKVGETSAYTQTQRRILESLLKVAKALEKPATAPIFVVAQSLGGQVLSSYLWDAMSAPKPFGLWTTPGLERENLSSGELSVARLERLERLYTTGCNIPVFVSGLSNIQPITPKNSGFQWFNFFDTDDVLGWPLAPLSSAYSHMVTDVEVNVSSGFLSNLLYAWNPLSHSQYWRTDAVLERIEGDLRRALEG